MPEEEVRAMQCKAEDCQSEVELAGAHHRLYCSTECKVRQNWRNQAFRRRGSGRPGRPRAARRERQCAADGCSAVIAASAHPLRLLCSEACKRRESERRERYGVFGATLEDYDRLFMEQAGRCSICQSSTPGRAGATRFAFDHDHDTNRPRGLLCHLCNVGLGSFQDDPVLLRAAIAYLETHAPTAAMNPGVDSSAAAVAPRSMRS
jgi:hypothetical protein